jgi:alkylation response protein AidB-like acyl-CoA dehydrogenase
MPFPEEVDGLGGNAIDLTIIAEELARKSPDFFMSYAGSVFTGLNILRKGTDEQRQYWLPKIFEGEVRMAIAISEPEAGSDISAMRTYAVRDGDDYIVNGQKLWATGAGAKNTVMNVYLRTDREKNIREGMSLFLIDNDTPGVQMRKLDMLGRRCTGTYEVFFNDVRVPADRLVGGENKGWDCVLSGLQIERLCTAAGNCGASQAAFDLALSYAKERVQFGRPIGTNQSIAHTLANMETEIDAARTLMWRAAWMITTGQDALREITMAKLFCSELYVKVANMGMQIMGGYGYSMEYDMQRHYRDARSATIAAGSSEMQRNVLAGLMGLKVR